MQSEEFLLQEKSIHKAQEEGKQGEVCSSGRTKQGLSPNAAWLLPDCNGHIHVLVCVGQTLPKAKQEAQV